ncbi:unnamed protein product [Rotaria sp. Silwood2]|nr:unnamed protein product [Rotaria sp. Silwood2]CAF2719031.1 unnamed protein product [Rotaria sp. Silwood2]CAF3121588.1 unnamed protein product [Rotaria sp. Silwood2]CAF3351625.1 unnamed protein product [Rotaria sp. Silwood2]CAF4136570.1 unnamed protein product [Rotaria sp. Silwood2]
MPNASFTVSDEKQNSNDIKISGALNKCGFVSGEKSKCKLEIFNTNRLLIENIVISVFYTSSLRPRRSAVNLFQSNSHTRTILEQIVTSIDNTRNEIISELLDGFIDTGTHSIQISYALTIELKVEGILTGINATVPIIIGTIPHLVGQFFNFRTYIH